MPHHVLTLMNSRVTDAVAVTPDRWPLAGDQVYVDMDISRENRFRGVNAFVVESRTFQVGNEITKL